MGCLLRSDRPLQEGESAGPLLNRRQAAPTHGFRPDLFRHKHNSPIRFGGARHGFRYISVLCPKPRSPSLRPVDHRQTKELNSGIAN